MGKCASKIPITVMQRGLNDSIVNQTIRDLNRMFSKLANDGLIESDVYQPVPFATVTPEMNADYVCQLLAVCLESGLQIHVAVDLFSFLTQGHDSPPERLCDRAKNFAIGNGLPAPHDIECFRRVVPTR
jgi:hypothetical protein